MRRLWSPYCLEGNDSFSIGSTQCSHGGHGIHVERTRRTPELNDTSLPAEIVRDSSDSPARCLYLSDDSTVLKNSTAKNSHNETDHKTSPKSVDKTLRVDRNILAIAIVSLLVIIVLIFLLFALCHKRDGKQQGQRIERDSTRKECKNTLDKRKFQKIDLYRNQEGC